MSRTEYVRRTGPAARLALSLGLVLAGFSAPALAAKHHRRAAIPALRMIGHGRAQIRMPASPTDPAKDAALIVDGATGKVIYARNELAERHPHFTIQAHAK